jgi:hypothetical protein
MPVLSSINRPFETKKYQPRQSADQGQNKNHNHFLVPRDSVSRDSFYLPVNFPDGTICA